MGTTIRRKKQPKKIIPRVIWYDRPEKNGKIYSSILNGLDHLHQSKALHRARGDVRKRHRWKRFRKKRTHRFHINEYNDYTLKRTPGVTRGILVL